MIYKFTDYPNCLVYIIKTDYTLFDKDKLTKPYSLSMGSFLAMLLRELGIASMTKHETILTDIFVE